MNREIKFRGKRKNGPEWLIGDLSHIDGKVFVFDRTGKTLNSPDWYEVDPETVGEYTGLKDKNGKEIYEGDIIQSPSSTQTVYFENGCFGAMEKKKSFNPHPLFEMNMKYWEIIGNIHENPELLK